MMPLNNPIWSKLNTISPSRISSYIRCGERFRLERIEGLKAPSGINAHRGSGLHAAIEEDNKYYRLNGEHLNIDRLLRIGNLIFDSHLKKGVFIPVRDIDKKDKLIDKAREEMNKSIELYFKMEKPWEPEIIEEYWSLDMGYSLPAYIKIDMIDEDHVIYDWKTSAKNMTYLSGLQDLFYSKAHEITFNRKPRFKYVKFILVKDPYVDVQELPQPENYDMLDRYVEAYLRGVNNNVFLPASNTDYLCSEGGCPFFLNCQYIR